MDCKKILFKEEARNGLKKGIDKVAEAVKVTLGYGGRTVVISETGMPARTTKDGVTVANAIKLRDEIEDAGAKLIRETSYKVAEEVGDGTTTVCVLMQDMVEKGLSQVAAKANPVILKKGMEAACAAAIEVLNSMRIDPTDELLKAVATVSANNDPEIGEMIGDAYKKLGKYGTIAIDDSRGPDTYIKVVEGFEFDSGFISHHFINNPADNTCELKKPYVLVTEGKIMKSEQIFDLCNKVAGEQRSMIIIAEDFDHQVIATMLRNAHVFQSCLIKYNFLGDTKQEMMYDICAITGATIAEKKGDIMQKLDLGYLGECESAVIEKDKTLFVGGKRNTSGYEARISDAKVKVEKANNPFIKQKAERRLAKLSGCVAICYVGGATELEVSEKKDRIDDSIKATRAAAEDGVVPGGGVALFEASYLVERKPQKSFGAWGGDDIVTSAMKRPINQIVLNSTGDTTHTANILSQVVTADDGSGYNAKTEKIENMVSAGIVDPLKVVRICLESAVSSAIQVIMSESLIVSDN